MNKALRRTTLAVVQIAVASATVSAAKFALMAIPNVEAVSLLLAVYGFVLGWKGIAAALVFCASETLIWGAGTWVVTYFMYWPSLASVFALLGKTVKPSAIIATVVAFVMTLWFCVLSSLVDVGLTSGNFENFGERFTIYFLRGTWFYVAQIVCNLVLFPLLFKPLTSSLNRLINKTPPLTPPENGSGNGI